MLRCKRSICDLVFQSVRRYCLESRTGFFFLALVLAIQMGRFAIFIGPESRTMAIMSFSVVARPLHRLSNSSVVNPACLKIPRYVPIAISLCSGTIAIRVPASVCFANLTWLPDWLTMR